MEYSASQAAKATGKSVQTITRAIKQGVISAQKQGRNGYLIDASELHRVFPAVPRGSAEAGRDTVGTPDQIANLQSETTGLERVIATLEQALADSRADCERWRQQSDGWQRQAERLALERPVTPAPPATEDTRPAAAAAPAGWRGFLRGWLGG